MHRVSVIKFHTPVLNYRQLSLYLSATSTPKPRFLRRVLNYVKQEPLSFAGHLLFTLVCMLVFWCGAQWMHYKCSALKIFLCLSDWGRDSSLAVFAEAFALEAPQIKIFLFSLTALITSLPKEHSSLPPKSCCCAGCICYCAAGPHNKDQLSLMRPVVCEMTPVALLPPHPHPEEFINMLREGTVCWDLFRLFQLIPVTPKLSKRYCFTFTCVIYRLLFVYMWFPIKYGTKCLWSTWNVSATTLLSSYYCCPPTEEFFFLLKLCQTLHRAGPKTQELQR